MSDNPLRGMIRGAVYEAALDVHRGAQQGAAPGRGLGVKNAIERQYRNGRTDHGTRMHVSPPAEAPVRKGGGMTFADVIRQAQTEVTTPVQKMAFTESL